MQGAIHGFFRMPWVGDVSSCICSPPESSFPTIKRPSSLKAESHLDVQQQDIIDGAVLAAAAASSCFTPEQKVGAALATSSAGDLTAQPKVVEALGTTAAMSNNVIAQTSFPGTAQKPRFSSSLSKFNKISRWPAPLANGSSSCLEDSTAGPAPVLRKQVSASLEAFKASAFRDISVAARVHTGATVAVVIPEGTVCPNDRELTKHGLVHHPNTHGWTKLTDGSSLGMLQPDKAHLTGPPPLRSSTSRELSAQEIQHELLDLDLQQQHEPDSNWVNHGQAKALCCVQLRIVKLLSSRVPVSQQAELCNAQTDYHEVLSRTLPGARMWPIHDPLVSRVFALNISRERFRSLAKLCRLDRGVEFLDFSRIHYGEEVAFLFAWQSHYIYMLAGFVALTVPLIIMRTVQGKGHIGPSMLPHSALTVIFGVLTTQLWKCRVARLVPRWHAHGDSAVRWHRMAFGLLQSRQLRTLENHELALKGQKINVCLRDVDLERGTDKSVDVMPSSPRSPKMAMDCADSAAMDRLEHVAITACVDTIAELGPRAPSECGWRRFRPKKLREDLVRALKTSLIIPILLLEWTTILIFFSGVVWFEIWVIFDWGGCREFNMQAADNAAMLQGNTTIYREVSVDEWKCLSADYLRGPLGSIMGALPSIIEGAFFELLLLLSKTTAYTLIGLYRFKCKEKHDFAVVCIIFLLEVFGKLGFCMVLGIGFVSPWSSGHWIECRENWDYFIMGDWSLGCLKGQIPFQVRLHLFESAMKGPMLVSGLVSIGVKTLLPFLLALWRRSFVGEVARQRRCCFRILLAPFVFVLRTTLLIFQADWGAVGGFRILCQWPATLAEEESVEEDGSLQKTGQKFSGFGCDGDDQLSPPNGLANINASAAQARIATRRSRLHSALLEGERREHEPFDEYLELLLHFLWTSCFAIVWPLGCVFSLLNQILEYRFDCMKLLAVRRRRFPGARHMSVAWVPRFAKMVCHISIVVNVALLLLPYRQLLVWAPGSCGQTEDGNTSFLVACQWPQIIAAFLVTWLCFLVIRLLGKALVKKLTWCFKACPCPCLGGQLEMPWWQSSSLVEVEGT